MSEKRYLIPDGMWHAAEHAAECGFTQRQILEAALRWWAEKPIVPTAKQSAELEHLCRLNDEPTCSDATFYCAEWQRLCFLAPEPEVPEAVKDLMMILNGTLLVVADREMHDRDILEAFRRGLKSAGVKAG